MTWQKQNYPDQKPYRPIIKKQRATAVALGLKKMHSSAIQEDTPDIMGKIHSISHLVTVEPYPEKADN